MLFLRLLSTLSVAAVAACGYSLDVSASDLSIRLTDVDTNISPVSLLFQNKATKATIEGLSWTKSSSKSDDTTTPFLNYTTFLDDDELASGAIQLCDDSLHFPDSIDAGVFSMTSTGSKMLRVVLVDSELETTEVQREVRASQAWVAGIPLIVSLVLFFVFKTELLPTLFVSIFIGSCITHGRLVQGFRAIFDTYLLNTATSSEHVSL